MIGSLRTLRIVPLVATLALAAACSREASDEKGAGDEPATQAHAQLRRQSDGSVVVAFDQDARERLGVKLEQVHASQLAPELAGYARVLDAAPFVALAGQERAAGTALEAATKELARSSRLASDESASARSLEAAEVAAAQARAAFDDVHARLLLAWSAGLASRSDLDALVAALVSRSAALVRIDVQARAPVEARGVRLVAADGTKTIAATLVGPAGDVDPQLQGRAFLALVWPNDDNLAAGTFLSAFVELEGSAVEAVVVPRSAIVRAEGKAWVYVAQADGEYHRVETSLDRATAEGWLATHGLSAGDRIVIEGAQQILSEEAGARGRGGD